MLIKSSRSINELIFITCFVPIVIIFYLIYKYPLWFVAESRIESSFYWFGKSSSFWYQTLYTLIVCFISLKIVIKGKSPYIKSKRAKLSNYQRSKFISIFLSQLIFFYFIPFILPEIISDKSFFDDKYKPLNKDAYIYVYNGFTSLGGFLYVFILVPLSVWFFGKRYCSWFCACGNLAEVIGSTKWGNKWVRKHTPRGNISKKLEIIQYVFLVFAICFGMLMFFNAYKIVTAPDLINLLRSIQDLVVDLMFGALIGICAYPFLGSRIWCRYGCPLAGLMRLFGKFSKSKFQVKANNSCKGFNLCTTQCPMGIDVASYAHKNKKPINGSFGLQNSPCIGCGGCVDICPVKALSFTKILNPAKFEKAEVKAKKKQD